MCFVCAVLRQRCIACVLSVDVISSFGALEARCLVQSWLLENGADCITCKWEVFGKGRLQGELLWDRSWDCPVLDTAEPISHVCGTSMKIYLRKCRKHWREV